MTHILPYPIRLLQCQIKEISENDAVIDFLNENKCDKNDAID